MKNLLFLYIYKLIFMLFIIFSAYFSIGRVEERTLEIQSKQQAVKEWIQAAELKLTEELILEMLELESLDSIRSAIKSKILPQRKKFILFTKILKTEEVENSEGKKDSDNKLLSMSILIRFSKQTLKKILIEENLFYLDKSSNRILVLVEFKDKEKNDVYCWWRGDFEDHENVFFSYASAFYSQVQSMLLKHGFYMIHPLLSLYHRRIPESKRCDSINERQAGLLARWAQAQLMIIGSVQVSASSNNDLQLIWNTALYHSISLRKLGEHRSRVKAPKDFMFNKESISWVRGFALKMSSIYDKGILKARLFKIDVEGALSFLEREKIKEHLVSKIKNIKNLTESVVYSQRIQYKADIEGSSSDVLKDIKALKILDFKLSPYIKSKNHIVIRVSNF